MEENHNSRGGKRPWLQRIQDLLPSLVQVTLLLQAIIKFVLWLAG